MSDCGVPHSTSPASPKIRTTPGQVMNPFTNRKECIMEKYLEESCSHQEQGSNIQPPYWVMWTAYEGTADAEGWYECIHGR